MRKPFTRRQLEYGLAWLTISLTLRMTYCPEDIITGHKPYRPFPWEARGSEASSGLFTWQPHDATKDQLKQQEDGTKRSKRGEQVQSNWRFRRMSTVNSMGKGPRRAIFSSISDPISSRREPEAQELLTLKEIFPGKRESVLLQTRATYARRFLFRATTQPTHAMVSSSRRYASWSSSSSPLFDVLLALFPLLILNGALFTYGAGAVLMNDDASRCVKRFPKLPESKHANRRRRLLELNKQAPHEHKGGMRAVRCITAMQGNLRRLARGRHC